MATTSPDGIYSPDAGQQYALTQDLLLMADTVQDGLTSVRDGIRYRTGSSSDRDDWNSPGEGALFWNTTSNQLQVYQSGVWARVWPVQRTWGVFAGATSGTGTATFNHNLGTTPSWVSLTDRVAGAVPEGRKLVVSATSATQVQVVVYYGDSPLPGNPVEFYWETAV